MASHGLSTTLKVTIGVGVAAAAAFGAYMMYKSMNADRDDDDDSTLGDKAATKGSAPPTVDTKEVTHSVVDSAPIVNLGVSHEGSAPMETVDDDPPPKAASPRSHKHSSPPEETLIISSTSPSRDSKSRKQGGDAGTAAADEPVDLPTVLAILRAMHRHIQQLALSLAQRQLDAQGRSSPMPQHEVIERFNRRAHQIAHAARERHGNVSLEAFDSAVEKFGDDPEVAEHVQYLEQLKQAVASGDSTVLPDVPDDMTLDVFMDKLDIFAAAVHENIEESIAKAKKDYAGQEDLARRVADNVLVNAKRAEGQAYERMGITQPMFQACMKKYQFHPRVQERFAQMSAKNAQLVEQATTKEEES